MSIVCSEIINVMEDFAPSCLAESWDNVGLLVGDKKQKINKVLFALDATDEVIEEAVNEKADLIITHHPIIFNSIKSVNSDTLNGKLYKLIKNNISVYSAHTNFDITYGGTNDILADIIGLKNVKILAESCEYNGNKYGIGRIGKLDKKVDFRIFIDNLKQLFDVDSLKVVGDINKKVKNIAICTGSGSDYLTYAYNKNADVFISGDVKFHDAQLAKELGILWIDLTHYTSENIAMSKLRDIVEKVSTKNKWELELVVSKIDGQPFVNM